MSTAILHVMPKRVEPPPCTPESIEAAKAANIAERREVARLLVETGAEHLIAAMGLHLSAETLQDEARIEGVATVFDLVQRFGARRVHAWVRNAALAEGLADPCVGLNP